MTEKNRNQTPENRFGYSHDVGTIAAQFRIGVKMVGEAESEAHRRESGKIYWQKTCYLSRRKPIVS